MKTPDNDLKDFGRRMPFSVPEGYFDSLSRQILAAAESEKASATAVPRQRRKFVVVIRRFAVAASIALVAAAVFASVLRSPSVTFEDVEEAYSLMSSEDQNLIDTDYNDDIFLALTE